MRFVIITGLSGAGKSQAVDVLEDSGYFCVDNLPPSFISKFAELCFSSQGKLNKVAMVCDIRGGEMFGELAKSLEDLKSKGFNFELLFLEANDETLIKRYKESRRKHPLMTDDRLPEAIARERKVLEEIKSSATHIIDTSTTTRQQLKSQLLQIYAENDKNQGIVINIISFGFKYGIPLDADLVFDVRFLPNPYYIPELKNLTGLNDEVVDYVMSFPQSKEFKEKLFDMIDYLLPHYIEEGKSQIVIAIGCTGGMHRSVTFARHLAGHIKSSGFRAYTTHRDCKCNF
ncbi:MAG: RNase adapter RapZ [Eubacteriales bacterium]|jgi:UPF0042 nucleotide-binding protein|nr:RNase adapter RapZ [Eubacteriales bacterium]